MRLGKSPQEAADDVISRIAKYYPGFTGAIVVANIKIEYGRSLFTPVDYLTDKPVPFCSGCC